MLLAKIMKFPYATGNVNTGRLLYTKKSFPYLFWTESYRHSTSSAHAYPPFMIKRGVFASPSQQVAHNITTMLERDKNSTFHVYIFMQSSDSVPSGKLSQMTVVW